MKNVCIVARERITADNGGENAVLNAFSLRGYTFEEIHILSICAEERLRALLKTSKTEYDNVLLLADKSQLFALQKIVQGSLTSMTRVSNFGGAEIYENAKGSVFILSSDEGETGVAFVKNACIPHLQRKYDVRYEELVVRSVGANEDRVRLLLSEGERLSQGIIRFQHFRKYDEDVIGILYDNTAPKMLVDQVVRLFADGLSDTVYALNDVSLEEQLLSLLKLRGKKLSVAESFTGGGIAKRITSVSGASEVYFEGVNTYHENAKIKRLGVSEYALRAQGAVSDQTAYEMALGLLNTGDCDISIATTGLAGPKTDRSMLPVGLCYIAVGTREKIFVYRYKFDGDRKEITEKAINYALFLAYKQLKNI